MLGRQEADLNAYSLAACFYDDSGYFGQGLCLLAVTATTWLLLLSFSNMHASGKSVLFPCHSTLNVSWYMTYLRSARAGSQAFSVLFITSV